MFFRKFLVVTVPMVLCAAILFFHSFLSGIIANDFVLYLLCGIITGVFIALLIPLMGGRRREPFASLFWIPFAILIIVLGLQGMMVFGWLKIPFLSFLNYQSTFNILIEGIFTGFLLTVAIRGR